MAVYQLKTFEDIYEAIREELQFASTDTTHLNRVKRDINVVYSEVVAENEWSWLYGHASLTLPAYTSTGTADVTVGSNTVTLSTAPGNSQKGKYFAVDEYNEIYRVESHTAASTTVKLATEYTGATDTELTYKLWSDRLALPTDCKEVVKVWHDHHLKPLDEVSFDEYRRLSTAQGRAEGRPQIFVLGDYVDPSQTSSVTSLPAVSTRASAGYVKTLVFASSIPTSIATRIANGDPVRWRVSAAGRASYNGDVHVTSVSTTTNSNDTVTYVSHIEDTESATADATLTVSNLDAPQDYDRFRELHVYPALVSTKVTLHVDYIKDAAPLENDSDEPVIPLEFRTVLFYGALAKAYRRAKDAEGFQAAEMKFQQVLARMQGKLQENQGFPRLSPSSYYLAEKRKSRRGRGIGSASFINGGSGGSGGAIVRGTPSTVATFNGSGELEGHATVSLTELEYLDGVTSNVQTQLDDKVDTADLDAHIADTVGAHNASAIASTPVGNLAATDVQTALDELQTDIDTRATSASVTTVADDLAAHIADTTAAHAASAIASTPSGNLEATDVQAALEELQSDIDGRAPDSHTHSADDITSGILPVSQGGTGASSLTANAVLLGNDASALQEVAPGDSGNVLTSDGTTWISAPPGVTALRSEVYVTKGNGHGSTNTKIRRFVTTRKNTGTAITYADSATLGASFTINEDGIYSITFGDGPNQPAANSGYGISVDSSELTTNIGVISAADRLLWSNNVASNAHTPVTVTTFLTAGSVVRPHTYGHVPTSEIDGQTYFRICKVNV